ncbi:hypothetical protein [Thorsellia anophelis]|uniref:Uncharacterized protein n=1 Tax=Thorsellia anophelis DSM 18579 TaxID=1123402 RepID=A0A1I0D1G5_9GAMM|nr:hypothetical protein [Thorsellia anophelis]SET25927.1 hypothetical protein SAMN02583745_01818 [Thorsellia anophelis DSM 18579]
MTNKVIVVILVSSLLTACGAINEKSELYEQERLLDLLRSE